MATLEINGVAVPAPSPITGILPINAIPEKILMHGVDCPVDAPGMGYMPVRRVPGTILIAAANPLPVSTVPSSFTWN